MTVKKIALAVDNFTKSEHKRRALILQIQELHQQGNAISKISQITGKDWRTVRKYVDCDPDQFCQGAQRGSLWGYVDYIIKAIEKGLTASAIANQLKETGYQGSNTNIRHFVKKIALKHGLELAKYTAAHPQHEPACSKQSKTKTDYITRKGIFNYLWMNDSLTDSHREYLWTKYDCLPDLENCIREFREIFRKKSMPLLYIFIENYKQSTIKEIASFANGLARDLEAVENAVASPLSNGFVEGNNCKVKSVKRTMYGRCRKILLEAKLMYANGG